MSTPTHVLYCCSPFPTFGFKGGDTLASEPLAGVGLWGDKIPTKWSTLLYYMYDVGNPSTISSLSIYWTWTSSFPKFLNITLKASGSSVFFREYWTIHSISSGINKLLPGSSISLRAMSDCSWVQVQKSSQRRGCLSKNTSAPWLS